MGLAVLVQGAVNSIIVSVNILLLAASEALSNLNTAVTNGDKGALLALLRSSALGLHHVKDENIDFYLDKLIQCLQAKKAKVNYLSCVFCSLFQIRIVSFYLF